MSPRLIRWILIAAAATSGACSYALLASLTFNQDFLPGALTDAAMWGVALPWGAAALLGAWAWARGHGRRPEPWTHAVSVLAPGLAIGAAVTIAAAAGGGADIACPVPPAVCESAAGLVLATATAWITLGLAFPALLPLIAARWSSGRVRPGRGPVPAGRLAAGIAACAAAAAGLGLFGLLLAAM